MIRTVTHLLLSGIYIINGWGAFSKPGGRPKLVAAAGIPHPEQAALLLGSMIPTTMVGHAFWKEEPGPQRQNQETQFLENLSLIGGLLMVLTEKNASRA